MLELDDYLRLLPKAELHCHFVSTMRVSTLVELCQAHRVPLKTNDRDALLPRRLAAGAQYLPYLADGVADQYVPGRRVGPPPAERDIEYQP